MSVEALSVRKTVVLKWDGVGGATVQLNTENPDTGERSTRGPGLVNDGYGTVSFPKDYHGKTVVKVIGSDGSETSGEIIV